MNKQKMDFLYIWKYISYIYIQNIYKISGQIQTKQYCLETFWSIIILIWEMIFFQGTELASKEESILAAWHMLFLAWQAWLPWSGDPPFSCYYWNEISVHQGAAMPLEDRM